MENKQTTQTSNDDVIKYVKLSEMTASDKLALPRFKAEVIKRKSKRGQIQYKLIVELHPLLKIERILLEKHFNLIVLERKLNFHLPIQSLIIPVRLIKGKSNTDRDWYRYEFFVSKSFTLNAFFDEADIALIRAGDIKLDFILSDEKYSDDVVNAFNDEDFEN